jgi:hypothetical protein
LIETPLLVKSAAQSAAQVACRFCVLFIAIGRIFLKVQKTRQRQVAIPHGMTAGQHLA